MAIVTNTNTPTGRKVLALSKKGLSVKEIAKRVERSVTCVSDYRTALRAEGKLPPIPWKNQFSTTDDEDPPCVYMPDPRRIKLVCEVLRELHMLKKRAEVGGGSPPDGVRAMTRGCKRWNGRTI